MRRTISLLPRPQTQLFGTSLTNSEQKDSYLQKKISIKSVPILRAVLVGFFFTVTNFFRPRSLGFLVNHITIVIFCLLALPLRAQVGALNDATYYPFIQGFADSLEAQLKNKCIGYQFTISYRNYTSVVSRAWGEARRSQDPPSRAMSANERIDIASVSKLMTGTAAVKLLTAKNISLDSYIYPYLPPTWVLGNNTKLITFRQLLNHKSGIRGSGELDDPGLQSLIANGVLLSDMNVNSYHNANFCLFRILIPRIENPLLYQNNNSPNYGADFIQHMQNNIFTPAGLSNITCIPPSPYPAKSYHYPSTTVYTSTDWGNLTKISGGGGFKMSSAEINKFLRELNFGSSIVPASLATTMQQNLLGYDVTGLTSKGVRYYKKNGGITWFGTSPQWWSGEGAVRSESTVFGNDVQCALIINSNLENEVDQASLIFKAFDANIILPPPTGLRLFLANGSDTSTIYAQWNNVVGASKYELQLALDAGFTQSLKTVTIPTTGQPVQLQSVSGLRAYTTYYARMRGINFTSEAGAYSSTTQGTTRAQGPTWLAVSNLNSGTGFTANWTPVPGAVSYNVQIYVAPIPGPQPTPTTANTTATNFTWSNLQPRLQYNYIVNAVMPNGSISTAPSMNGITLPPSKPIVSSITNVSSSGATVNWQPIIGAQFVGIDISRTPNNSQIFKSVNSATTATSQAFAATLIPSTTYYARVFASNIGGGPVSSAQSDYVAFTTPAATLNIDVTTISAPADSTTFYTVNVSSNYQWTASSNIPGFSTVSPTSGNGNGTAIIQVLKNLTVLPQTSIITFSSNGISKTVTVNQPALSPKLNVDVSQITADSTGYPLGYTVNLTSNTGWSFSSNQPWVTATPIYGALIGSSKLYIQPNTTTATRNATVTFTAGPLGNQVVKTISITQSGRVPVAPAALNVNTTQLSAGGTSGSYTVNITSNIAWTATSNQPWAVISPTAGNGTMAATIQLPSNANVIVPASRTAIITFTGGGITKTITVTQEALQPVLPAAPQNLVATAAHQQSLTVQWQPVSGASAYDIQYATNMNFTENIGSVFANTPTVLTSANPTWSLSAKPGTTYFVRMRTVGANGVRSEFSNVDTASTPPNLPLFGTANNILQDQFRVNWTLAEGATSYTLQVSTNATFSAQSIIKTFTNIAGVNWFVVTNQLLGTNLKAGATYYYRMNAISSAGVISAYNYPASVLIPSSALTAPTGVSVNNVSKTNFTATWQSVPSASGYEVQVSTNLNFAVGNTSFIVQGGNTLSIPLSGFLPSSTRYIRVRSLDANNNSSAYSSGIMVTTLPPSPAVPLAATNIGTTSFTANWQNSSDGGTTTLEIIFDSGVRWQYQPTGTSITITNLQVGSVVFYRVRANGGGAITTPFSTQQIKVELQTNQAGIATPTAYMPTNVGITNAIARWSLVSGATGYELQVASDVAFKNVLQTYPLGQAQNTPQLTLSNLSPGKTVFYRVRALGPNNTTSPYSNVATVLTMPETPVIAPATNLQPINFTANWQATLGAKGYNVQAATDINFTTGVINASVLSPTTSCTFTVPAGKTYYFRVRAYGESVSGLWSNFQTATLPTGQVSGLVAFDAINPSSTSFTAEWQAINGAASYTVQVATDRNFNSIVRTFKNVITTSVVVNGLQSGWTYFYRVTANATAKSVLLQSDAPSNIVEVALPADVPTALQATNISSLGFTMNWEQLSDESAYIVQVASDAAFTQIINAFGAQAQTTSLDAQLPMEGTVYYRVIAVGNSGTASNPSNVIAVTQAATSVRLLQNTILSNVRLFPNPGRRGETHSLEFTTTQGGEVTISVVDVLGREIAMLEQGTFAAGQHTALWMPPATIAQGVYWLHLKINGLQMGSIMVMLRD